MNTTGLPEQKIREALFFIDCNDSDLWIKIGFALYSELGDSGFDLWDSWSSSGATYDKKNIRARWKGMRKGTGGKPVTIGTLIYEAMKGGFKFDEKVTRISPEKIKEREERKKQIELEAQAEIANEFARNEKAKKVAQIRWNSSREVESHPYLTKKDVFAHGLRVGPWPYGNRQIEPNALIVPLYYRGELVSVQGIFPEKVKVDQDIRDKFYLYGAKKSGVYSPIGTITDTILICEGWATGATLHEATQLYVAVAMDSGNLVHVAKEIRRSYPFSRIVICADNDQYKSYNTGIKSAVKAACEVDADVVYPVFKCVKNKPTDFNDLYFESGSYNAVLERVVKPSMFKLEPNNKPPVLSAFELPYVEDSEKVLEESSDPIKVASAALQQALFMSLDCPAFNTMDMIRNHIQHPLIHHKTHLAIMRRVQWAIHQRKRIALTAIKPEKWGNHKHVVVGDLSEIKLQKGVNLIFAPMGSGKTQKIIKPFSEHDKIFCAIAHRRSLISELSGRLNVDNYEDKNSVEYSEKVAVCLPSSMSTRFKPFIGRVQNVAIDEASQNIAFTRSKECRATGVDQEGVFMGLKDLVNKSEMVVAADASIDPVTMEFMEIARPDEEFTIFEQVPNNKHEKKCFMYDEQGLLSRIQCELLAGGKVWLAVESVAAAEAIHALFRDNHKCILITSKNNTSKASKALLADVDGESRKFDMVIASPVISSGVSVEHGTAPHFTMIAGIASGSAICFSDFAQMLARVRYVNEYHICLKKNNQYFEGVTAHTILLGQRQAALLEGGSLKENEYTRIMALIDERERAFKADFANGFIWFLQYHCFEILGPQKTEIDYSIVDKLKEITKENREKARAALCNARCIDPNEAQELDVKRELSDEEQTLMLAFTIRQMLGYEWTHELSLLDIEMFEHLPSIDRFARYQGLQQKHNDTERNIALRKFGNAQVIAIERLLCGNKLEDTLFTAEKCKEIITNLCANENRFMMSALKLVPSSYAKDIQDKRGNLKPLAVPTNCAKAMGRIVEKFGLKWKRVTRGHSRTGEIGYMVTEDSFALMKEYSLRRYEKMLA